MLFFLSLHLQKFFIFEGTQIYINLKHNNPNNLPFLQIKVDLEVFPFYI